MPAASRMLNFAKFHPWDSQASVFGAAALAASAGGLACFREILCHLPSDFPVPVLIAQHRLHRDSGHDTLVEILQAHSRLRIVQAEEGAALQAGTAYVSPPNRQFLVTPGARISLRENAYEKRYLPSADQLFTSLANCFASRLIVAVLSGALSDGAFGITQVKAKKGRVLVQDPQSAFAAGMPNAAIATGCVDFVLPLERVADALITLTMVPGATDLFSSPLEELTVSPILA